MMLNEQFYDGDIVVRSIGGETIEFGEVVEIFGTVSDYGRSGSAPSSVCGEMNKSKTRVRWYPSGKEEEVRENIVCLVDRRLITSTTVSRAGEGKGPLGYVRGVRTTASVHLLGSEYVISGVKSENLTPLRQFEEEMTVCLNSWIGHVERVKSRITLRTSDGSRCDIKDVQSDLLFSSFLEKDKVHRLRPRRTLPEVYPGQKLRGPLCGLKRAAWLNIAGKLKANIADTVARDCEPSSCCEACRHCKYVKLTVEKIETESVRVKWTTRGYFKDCVKNEDECYDSTVTGNDLKRLKVLNDVNPFDQSYPRLGKRLYYTFSENDKIEKWPGKMTHIHAKEIQDNSKTNCLTPSEADASFHKEDIKSIEKTNLVCPEKEKTKLRSIKMTKVTFKTSLAKKKLTRSREKVSSVTVRPGMRLAVETISTKSLVTVIWQDGSVECDVPSTDLNPVWSEDREYFPGDFVLKDGQENTGFYGVVQTVDRANRTSRVRWFQPYTSRHEKRPMFLECCETSLYDLKGHTDFLHHVGSVVVKLDNFEEDTKYFVGQISEKSTEGKMTVRWVDGATSMCWPQDLLREREWMWVHSEDNKKNCTRSDESIWRRTSSEAFFERKRNPSVLTLESLREESQNLSDNASSKSVTDETADEGSGYFYIIETVPENHKFKIDKFIPDNAKWFSITVQREIKLLRSSLPGGIWVRGFEDRLDLFSAMICGLPKTPYEDALFLFDLRLPPDYPKSPVWCQSVSFCEDRIDTHFYESGKVCMSHLGTWRGRGTAVWTKGSNLLQVVTSIQRSILVSEPYFNEARNRKWCSMDYRENSQVYNETIVLETMQSSIALVRHPRVFFSRRSWSILRKTGRRLSIG